MSHVIVHDVSEIARRRIARQQQIEALPPGPERIARNLWVPWRRPWVHAAYAGTLGARVGPEPVELRALKRAALEQGLPLEEVEALTMDEVLVTPDFASATIAGQTVQVRYGTAQESAYEQDVRTKKPGILTGFEYTYIPPLTLGIGESVSRRTTTKSAPIIIESIWVSHNIFSFTDWLFVSVSIPGIGFSYTVRGAYGINVTNTWTIPVMKMIGSGSVHGMIDITNRDPYNAVNISGAVLGFTWRELQ